MSPANEGALPGVRAAGHLQLADVAERHLGQRRSLTCRRGDRPGRLPRTAALPVAGEPVPVVVGQADPGTRGGVDRLQGFGGELLRRGRNDPAAQQEKNGDDGVRAHLCSRWRTRERSRAAGQASVKQYSAIASTPRSAETRADDSSAAPPRGNPGFGPDVNCRPMLTSLPAAGRRAARATPRLPPCTPTSWSRAAARRPPRSPGWRTPRSASTAGWTRRCGPGPPG